MRRLRAPLLTCSPRHCFCLAPTVGPATARHRLITFDISASVIAGSIRNAVSEAISRSSRLSISTHTISTHSILRRSPKTPLGFLFWSILVAVPGLLPAFTVRSGCWRGGSRTIGESTLFVAIHSARPCTADFFCNGHATRCPTFTFAGHAYGNYCQTRFIVSPRAGAPAMNVVLFTATESITMSNL